MALSDTPVYERTAAADLMALVDTYADTACVNGIRSGWATMARASIEGELIKMRAAEAEVRKQDEALIRKMREALEHAEAWGEELKPAPAWVADAQSAIAAANARLKETE